ncbi:hypothetical protein [Haladaptatus caseinilyticus]|nr:hypothetical protein [Haladaptatus caseinilyticus]
MPSRRRFLALGAVTAITGCTTIADDPPEPGSNQSTDPDRHIYGADGE